MSHIQISLVHVCMSLVVYMFYCIACSVICAVGMMYLADLDDPPGYTITLSSKTEAMPESLAGDASVMTEVSNSSILEAATIDMAAKTEKILAEAHAKLDALATASRRVLNKNNNGGKFLEQASYLAQDVKHELAHNKGHTDQQLDPDV